MKSLSTFGSLVLAAALCGLPLTGRAQTQNNQNASPLSASDKAFVDKAAEGGLDEVELGNLALQKAANPDVKSFAQRMVHDHSQANEKLNQVAEREGISVPKKLSAKDAMFKDRLEKLHGEAFDKAYMQDQVQDHKEVIAAFRQESQGGRNSSVKHFATETLPTLESHLQEAESVAPKVNASTSARAER